MWDGNGCRSNKLVNHSVPGVDMQDDSTLQQRLAPPHHRSKVCFLDERNPMLGLCLNAKRHDTLQDDCTEK